MSKQKTLFSFFKKVPSTESEDGNKCEESPKAKGFESPKLIEDKKPGSVLEIYLIVWCKLDSYPWWPAIVCQDPDTNNHLTKSEVHVQFFDQPPTRAWVNRKNAVLPYNAEGDSDKRTDVKCSQSDREKLKIACNEADAALKIRIQDRDSLLVDFGLDNSSFGTDKENTDPPSPKKMKLLFDSEDSGDDYKPGKNDVSDDDEDDKSPEPSDVEEDTQSDSILEDEDDGNANKKRKRNISSKTPKNKKKKMDAPKTPKSATNLFPSTPTTPSTPSTPKNLSNSTLQKISAFKTASTPSSKSTDRIEGNWPHLKLQFLSPDKIMDKNKRRPDDPEYDRKTLHVPEEFKNQCSPGIRQWWELKSEHWDCVLFFKVGKFYELYHMDAVLGVNELSLSLMRGDFAHSGFPEIAYGRFATILVQKGYKVARVEQMETPDMMAERCKNSRKSTKFDKVVQREVCQVASKGTVSHNVMDGQSVDPQANYLLAITEKDGNFGVCFVDASIGIFHVGQFKDDKYLSRLRTLFSHCSPAEIIYEKKEVSEKTVQLLNSMVSGVLQQPLQSESEFWSAKNTLSVLAARSEFKGADGSVVWPSTVRKFISPNDALGLTPAEDGQLALKSLGACVGYLQRSFLDSQLLALKQFQLYDPLDVSELKGSFLVLDDITLTNLEVLKNCRGGLEGTLLARLDHCSTFPGKRLLRQWLCAPLANPAEILARQTSVQELEEAPTLVCELKEIFKTVPDLERLMAKIHFQGNPIVNKSHPDSRAIFFEEKTYSKRKIQDFLQTLTGFEKLQTALSILKDAKPQSQLLHNCADCPDLTPKLSYFKEAFDHDQAKKEGSIVPNGAGVDPEYDAANEEIKNIEKELQSYLKKQCEYFGVQVKYFGTEKNRFQLEVADGASKKANSEYEFTTARKGFKRFSTKVTKEFLKRQTQAEDARTSALRDLRRRIFEQFGKSYDDWKRAISCMAQLDVLMSFAEYARYEGNTCMPVFHPSVEQPFVSIKEGRHPCIPVADGFIPNSTKLGTEDWRSLVVLTGPNMGGKSTLLRQLGLHVIMAHVGCRLPAASAQLTPVDRIFTRIGAGDDILAGESTFFQELSETGLILQHASDSSVVLVDELGRGTSTYDGTAIAHAVLVELAKRKCRTLFSTHYHALVEEMQIASDRVSLGHMACMAEGDNITFLYQFIQGACPSSHGFHAARLAGLPEHIIQLGQKKAEQLTREGMRRKLFRKLCRSEETSEDLSDLVDAISRVL